MVCGLSQRFRDCYDVDSCDVVVTGIFHQVGAAGGRSSACLQAACCLLPGQLGLGGGAAASTGAVQAAESH